MENTKKLKIALWKLPFFLAVVAGANVAFSEQGADQQQQQNKKKPSAGINRRPGGWNQSPVIGERPSSTHSDGSPVASPTIAPSQQPATQLEEQLGKSKGFTGFRKSIGTIEMRIDRMANGRLQVTSISPEHSQATGIRDKDEFANWEELGAALNGDDKNSHSKNSD